MGVMGRGDFNSSTLIEANMLSIKLSLWGLFVNDAETILPG